MKIIYIENVRIPSERAHAYQIVQTCAEFARQGHDVVLVNPDRAGDRNLFDVFGIERDLFQHVRLPVIDPLAWSWFPSKKVAYAMQRFFFVRAARAWADRQHADVWYTRDPAMVDVLGRNDRLFTLELHDDPTVHAARWNRVQPFIRRIVAITNGLANLLKTSGVDPSMMCVAPDGYDPATVPVKANRDEERRRLGLPLDAFVAMYTGSFYPWKGVDLLIRAWPQTDSRAHLVLIGGPEGDRERLLSLIDQNVSSRIHIFPMMERSAALAALAAADIGLLTSSKDHAIGRISTSPLKQFEYLASGLPILASDVPSSHEVLTDDVAMFYEYSPQGIVEGLARSMKDEAWRDRARSLGPTVVAPYTWEARARTILKHIAV